MQTMDQLISIAHIPDNNTLLRFGFKFGKNSAHTARTMMVNELRTLLSWVDNPEAEKEEYIKAIVEDNCLGKRTAKNRELTARHLIELYALDSSVAIFRALRFFWEKDHAGQNLLALLCAYARDTLLRLCVLYVLHLAEGSLIDLGSLINYIKQREPYRFSNVTIKSIAQNISATFTKSGHLRGRSLKIRARAKATPGTISYALFLGYLNGIRGQLLFNTEYIELLDSSKVQLIEMAEEASRCDWILFKHIGNIIEVAFPRLLNAKELEWIRE